MDGQLLYTFLSLATGRDTPSGRAVPIEGMKLISALAHRCDIPVTWIVDSQSVQESRDFLFRGHQECGDDVILLIDIPRVLRESGVAAPASKAEEIVVLRQNLPVFITSEQGKIREMLPWAEVNIIAADAKTDVLIEILEELDCIGLWGYGWNGRHGDTETRGRGEEEKERYGDKETRRHGEGATQQLSPSPRPLISPSLPDGRPWSFFYASRDHYNIPSQSPDGLVAVESTSLDLNAAFYSGNSRVFSAEPDALRRSKLYADKDISYPKAILEEYIRNCPWNRFMIFLQQQPAYQMEHASYDDYGKGTIGELADILGDFFHEVVYNKGIQALSLSEAIKLYREEFEYTEACCMVFDGIVPLQADIDFYVPPEPKQKPPYPFTFFYYDRECQLVFEEGQMTPVQMRNYVHPPFESEYYIEKEMPSISSFHPSRDRDKLILDFEIESIKQMPFGLAIWDDHSMFSLVSTNARLLKWIGTHLLFIRMDLEEGLNRVEVSLTI